MVSPFAQGHRFSGIIYGLAFHRILERDAEGQETMSEGFLISITLAV